MRQRRARVAADAARARQGGFTLVELMVTLMVMALMTGAVMWAMPDPRGKVRDDALRFAARVRAARDQAIAEAAPVSVWVTTGGYGFDRRTGGQWVAMGDKPLHTEHWIAGATADLSDPAGRVRVTFDPTGLPDRGADVRLALKGRTMLVRVGGDGSVRADAQ